jgi:flagellar hook-length control protein FliK
LENVNGEEQAPAARGGGERRQESAGDETARDDTANWSYALPAGAAVDAAPERVSAAEQLKAAMPEQPVARENLFDAMVERLEVMREDGLPQMTVELKPEYLGRVTLNLTAAPSGGVNLRISAVDPGVKGMIDGQIAALVENLSGKGVRLERVDVVYTGVGAGSGGYDGLGERTSEGKRGNARGGRSGRYTAGVSAVNAPAAAIELLRAAGLDAEYSEYEYSA